MAQSKRGTPRRSSPFFRLGFLLHVADFQQRTPRLDRATLRHDEVRGISNFALEAAMDHSEFRIGIEFMTGSRRRRCTGALWERVRLRFFKAWRWRQGTASPSSPTVNSTRAFTLARRRSADAHGSRSKPPMADASSAPSAAGVSQPWCPLPFPAE
jgi:hypothetical protein